MWFIILFLLFLLLTGIYTFKAFRQSLSARKKNLAWIYLISAVILFSGFVIMWQRQASNYGNVSIMVNILISLMIVVFLSTLFSTAFFVIDDVRRIFQWIFVSLRRKRIAPYPIRSRTAGISAVSLNSIVLALVLYGTLFGFTHFKVHRVPFEHQSIPEAFDGFKIVQISDLHLGTFGSVRQLDKGLKMITELNPDLIVFTGDLVNNLSVEAVPFINSLKKIEAPYGKFAIMGNHDYATYAGSLSKKEISEDIQNLKNILSQMGFTMLDNSNQVIKLQTDSIVLAGVENWGIAPFPQYGNLNQALAGISESFIIMLSHDPSHWSEQIVDFPLSIELTLSGHTHGMQMGIETKNFKWSPVQYRYKNWAGLYQQGDKYLYVNRGFGGIGFPGRIGIRPEITLIELKSRH